VFKLELAVGSHHSSQTNFGRIPTVELDCEEATESSIILFTVFTAIHRRDRGSAAVLRWQSLDSPGAVRRFWI